MKEIGMSKEWHMPSFRSAGLFIKKKLEHQKELKTFKNKSCINKRMQLDLLAIEINYGYFLNGRIIIKVENKPHNILT
jgi:hypothetical protein